MYYQGFYYIDLNVLFQLYQNNIWYILKILIMGYVAFIWLPKLIFPQEHTGSGMQKVVYNVVFMITYVEIVVPSLVLMKIFSILIFAISLFLTKLAFLKWYYKRSPLEYMVNLKRTILLWIFDTLDYPQIFLNKTLYAFKTRYFSFQQSFTFYNVAEKTLFISVFVYILTTLMLKGMYSYSDPASDTSQYIEWVGSIQKNILYADHKTFGAYFYGMPIIVFFVGLITNIDQIILLTLYPIILWLLLFFSLYFVVEKFTNSKYTALLSVMLFGMLFMSPVADIVLGTVVVTDHPMINHWHGLKFYYPSLHDVLVNGKKIGYQPYNRFMSSLAYEHTSVFVLLNTYFFTKLLQTRENAYLLMYALTLFLVFVFHAGGAIVLVVVSLLIAVAAILTGKYQTKLLLNILKVVGLSSILGSLWVLSMIKYGVPPEVGAAAPFLDDLIGTKGLAHTVKAGFESVSIIDFGPVHLSYFILLIIGFIRAAFTKDKFLNYAMLFYTTGIFIAYFGPHAGTIVLSRQGRLAEYLFLALTVMLSFHFYYFYNKAIILLFKKYANKIMLISMYVIFVVFVFALPKHYNTAKFWRNINMVQYTSIPAAILKINSENRPFSWSGVAYVQSFSKIRNKGYHINAQNFLMKYSPEAKYLTIPTEKVFIFTENEKNAYRGLGQWYYRWRGNIQANLKAWVVIYQHYHKNVKIYYHTKTITVYEIDNRAYIESLRKKN